MVYINVTYFTMTSTHWHPWHDDRTPSPPGGTPAPPRDGTSLCQPFANTPSKNGVKNPSELLHSPAYWSIVLVCQTWRWFFNCKKNTWTGMWHHFYHIWLCTQFTHPVTHNTDPGTSLGTPETTFTHFNQTTLGPQSVSVSSTLVLKNIFNMRLRCLNCDWSSENW